MYFTKENDEKERKSIYKSYYFRLDIRRLFVEVMQCSNLAISHQFHLPSNQSMEREEDEEMVDCTLKLMNKYSTDRY